MRWTDLAKIGGGGVLVVDADGPVLLLAPGLPPSVEAELLAEAEALASHGPSHGWTALPSEDRLSVPTNP